MLSDNVYTARVRYIPPAPHPSHWLARLSPRAGAGTARHPIHLCHSVACKLPAEDFWIANKKGADAELPE